MKATWTYCTTALGLLGCLPLACTSEHGSPSSAESNDTAVCTAEQQAAAYEKMINAPIKPPRFVGGLDLAGGDSWVGATFADAEKANCQSTPISDQDGLLTVGWGTGQNMPVQIDYDKETKQIESYVLNEGYKGSLEFKSRPNDLTDPAKANPFGAHTYSIGVGRPILRDGATWELNWKKACDPARPDIMDCGEKQATELFDALMYTFAPELPSTQKSCKAEQTCLMGVYSSSEAVFGARPLGIYMYVPSIVVPQPGPSTPGYLYGFKLKQTPFAAAEMFLKLDAEGPIATASNLGDTRVNCVLKTGMTFDTFLSSCVNILSDADRNAFLKKKILGGASHANDTWKLDVSGVRPSFASASPSEVEPASGALATELVLDIRSSGKVKNDYSADGTKLTLTGTGAVYREYGRLVQEFLHANMPANSPKFPIGAPECLLSANADPATWHPAAGCTGIEQLVTPAEPSTAIDPGTQKMSAGPAMAAMLGIRTALKPGDPRVVFCADPGTFERCGDYNTTGPAVGFSGSVLDTYRQVVTILGGGSEDAVPAAAKDPKVYARLWATALVKYLRAAPQSPANLSDPAFDALTPAASEITVEESSGWLTVKYLNRLELAMLSSSGQVQSITFR